MIRLDQPQVAGIVNVTPDSFSDGGRLEDPELAVQAGSAMAEAGAARSTSAGNRPARAPSRSGRGRDRRGSCRSCSGLAAAGTAVSVDTRKAPVMEAALAAGATLVNDVSALTWDPRAAEVVAAAGCPVVLMHHQGPPETMQDNPRYDRPVLFESL